ncbi:galactose-1-phosphate uridylyltransferase [Zychaea mexicana]|uniref:galactose-1-phosphate uridylyltransferase n=1 Tax=Zychaea mexicana TaxID=64656 RepID=UPI0022FDF482|nr:galactose-1-phosphate uridylyltransferase [Zychaea mexicana]KAI9471364.1 galactose-1-phosphate uridylyltransferase [Zychaea mexicana]
MSSSFDFNNHSHRRYNPLTRSWVLCSPHRTQRPWQGHRESAQIEKRPEYDPSCYLCPGNERANGEHNPTYTSTHSFPNDFAAVKSDQPALPDTQDDLLRAEGVRGECHVICFSPRHDLTMAEMSVSEIALIVDKWTKSYSELAQKDYIKHVQIFENKGAAMGCSNPHPHGQLWATEQIPEEPQVELESLALYKQQHKDESDECSCLLCNYVKRETEAKERIVIENESFVCIVPFWALWPFETLVLPKDHVSSLPKMSAQQKLDLADMLRRVTCRYDNLFECAFPYSMGIHQAPVQGDYDYAHLHLHFYPPLLRSATVRKFLVGFEMLGEPQRDLTPEQAAARLRACSEVHYKHRQVNGYTA